MPQLGLPINRLVSTQVVLSAQAVQAAAINTMMVLGTSDVIDTVERIREYSSLSAVAADFGGTTEEYLSAVAWFAQRPQPASIFIARWANAATNGAMVGGVLSTTEALLSNFTGVANGGFHVNVDGAGSTNVTGINLTGAANLNAVAALIQVAVRAIGTGGFTNATVVWNSVGRHFRIRSGTTGATSSVSFLTAPTAGTDLSPLLQMRSSDTDAYAVPGQALETALAAAALLEDGWGRTWYALVAPSGAALDHAALGSFIEACATPHFYGVTTQDAACLNPADTTNIAYVLMGLGLNKTAVQFSSTSAYAVVSELARILTTRWDGGNTAITLMWKQEPTITPELLTTTQANALQSIHCNVYAEYQNNAQLIQYGICSSGQYIDTVIGADALSLDVQTAIFNLLLTTTTKLPQTDPGVTMIINAAEAICLKYLYNGFLAAGIWTNPGFGNIAQGEFLARGFYVFAAPVATQSAADRGARRAPLIQIAARAGGAIHTADVLITVAT